MKSLRVFFRLVHIFYILARFRIDELVLHSGWFYSFRFFAYFNPMRYLSAKKLARGERLRMAFESLGPLFIKFGQILSTRRDLLPEDIALELARLQDRVKPFSGKEAEALIAQNLKKPIKELFKEFDHVPLASASIAQVHAAELYSGEAVVVKVRRPGIKKCIRQDIDVLKVLAKLAHYFLPQGANLKPLEIVKEFEMTLKAECDFLLEASNASTIRRHFPHSDWLYIPEVYWDYTTKHVLVMERIYGTPINDLKAIKKAGHDLKVLAERCIEIFFTQVFDHNFFHADMHPGNVFVNNKKSNQYIMVDFGIVSSLTESDRRYIAENLLAFFHRDYHRVAELHMASGWIDANTRLGEFEAAIRAASEPVFEKPLKDISMGQVIMNLIRIARAFHVHIQPQLILLQKTLLNVEGLSRELDPELDLWKTAKPFLEKWLKKQVGPRALLQKVKDNIPFWIEKLPDMPDLVYQALKQFNQPSSVVVMPEEKEVKKSYFFTWSFFIGCGLGVFATSLILLLK